MRVPEYMQREVPMKLSPGAIAPDRAHSSDAGADLRALEDHVIDPGFLKLIDTGVALKIPVGCVGLVYARSSMGKIRVTLANGTGVIDSDYRGNIKVMLVNEGNDPFIITKAETKIAQLVIVPIILANFVTLDSKWDDTVRGTGGFGSTGQ